MYVSTESYFKAEECEFTENYSNETSTIEILGSSKTENIELDYCTFETNEVIRNTMSLMYANVIIKNSEFINNIATERTKNIFCGFSTI